MAFPAGLTVQIEFGTLYSGVWTNVTADVDTSSQISMRFGRTSPQSQPQVAGLSLRLENNLGQYTPNRQVLADGTTAHPYYPNVVPDKRIQVGYTISSVFYPRYTGFIFSWVPGLENGVRAYVDITATDITDRLSRVTLQSPMLQELLQDNPRVLWTMTDPVGSPGAFDSIGNYNLAISAIGSGTPLAFGSTGPGDGDGTGVAFTPASSNDGQYLTQHPRWLAVNAGHSYTIEMWFKTNVAPANGQYLWTISDGLGALGDYLYVDPSGTINYNNVLGVGPGGGHVINGVWHHAAATFTNPSSTGTWTLYLDGVSLGSTTNGPIPNAPARIFNVGGGTLIGFVNSQFTGNIGYMAAYTSVLSSARIAAHYASGIGYAGETTGARIARMLAFAGLTSGQWNLDTGQEHVGTYPQAGKTVLQYCQDMAATEGGGAAFYATPDGKVRFADRTFRKPGAPALTVDAQKDLQGSSWAPSLDKSTLVNQTTVTRSTATQTASTQTATAATGFGLVSQQITSYATTDIGALTLAQDNNAANSTPGFRLPKIGIALLTAVNNLYVAVAGTQIGSRLRLTGIPAGKAPATQIDVLLEGWTETFTNNSYNWEADASPADNPAKGIYDDTVYGRYGPGGTCTLTSNINASVTSLSITTQAGYPTFTTVSARYPMNIQLGEEVITLNSAPGGSTSPQSFTGVTRGAPLTAGGANSIPAAQTAGTRVYMYQSATYAL